MMHHPRVLIMADDLTGAMDSAGPFAQVGAATWVVAAPMQCDPDAFGAAQVVSVNTDSRHLPGAQAASRLRAVLPRLRPAEFDLVVKKIDSTLRGNVVAETLALLQASGRLAAVVAPAFPAQGRTVKGSVVHVNGVPLAQTGFARDALSPPPLAPLDRVFAEAAPGLPVIAAEPSGLPGFETLAGICVVDSSDDADLAAVVTAAQTRLRDLLLVGSAGLTQALARACFGAGASQPAREPLDGTIVFAVGSRAVQSAEQVETLALEPGTAVLTAPNGRLAADALPPARNLVIRAVPDGGGQEADALQVAEAMARHALDVVLRSGAKALVATGGDTAVAILAASGNPAVRVLGDLMPGIPYARIKIDGMPIWLVTKAGGFGGRDTFRDLARRLRGG